MVGAWLLLLGAIGVEVASTAALPRTHGFRDPVWTALVLGGYALSIWLMAVVIRNIPVSVTYAVWSGLGTAGIALVGVVLLGEPWDLLKGLALLMIIGGVLVLNLHGAH
ncbi:multidrug efflux SMR transporter [Nocardioides panacis]|uniref:Multidrug efflux SMR transporter n=1 Tax=Nocardioides panacis TaxID=2849501 RepID=A0A975SWH9_9ACTN|nr:multidrug efflux SMR transporter [Nocardioides panacis]QWZ07214.1 multidrug efflux SMR transporter [Nocardioides panacis]